MLSSLRARSTDGPDSASDRLWQILSSKVVKLVATALVALCAALIWLSIFRPSYLPTLSANSANPASPASPAPITKEGVQQIQDIKNPTPAGHGRLHLLVPATSSNSNLCKLMLSAQVLGYPTPVLINYGDAEAEDGYVQHLAKVEGILNYLESLETSNEYAEDLVLIIDGYDIWFQLRPDVLIKRFYAINEAANARAVELYGADVVKQNDIRQTVIFGPDKICWPVDFRRPACWAVPSSPLPENLYGPPLPGEERNLNDAKWLNSGTVMGAAQDLREIFRATLNNIHANHITNSDQYYFANIFGEQEYARSVHNLDRLNQLKSEVYVDYEDRSKGNRTEPLIFGKRTEYHIGLDYESSMFQTLAFWKQHLSWSRAIDSWRPPISARYDSDLWDIKIAEDLQNSLPPFEPFKDTLGQGDIPGWGEVSLVYNILTKHHPVLLHVTGNPDEKRYRSYWWKRLWFQAQGEYLRLANRDLNQSQISPDVIDGKTWYNAEAGDADEIAAGGKGGAWTDRRGWLSWKRLCAKYEELLFAKPDEVDYYTHPSLGKKDDEQDVESGDGTQKAEQDDTDHPASEKASDNDVSDGDKPPAKARRAVEETPLEDAAGAAPPARARTQ